MELTFPLFAGIIAAVLHVISGPDHLAAVTPFAIESKKKAWKVGLFWGIGHLLGMLSIGVLFLFFKELIPIEKISEHSEKFVGVILIGLGLWIFLKIFKAEKKHKHTHIHAQNNPIIHEHLHKHTAEKVHTHSHPNLKQGNIASLSVGFVHGLAGVAHFLLFLPVIGFTSMLDSSKYIIGFGIGTLIAMISFAMVVGKVADFSKQDHNETFFKGIRLAGGLFAFIIGIYWVIAN
ncbi:urease accessory protein UreH domain-containing protein [Lutibacter maritimus]|uniref:ABC-type nickel/cobalt efflux system, permease component RcnA n=1 Tax=Lutibacter maritimus TaxID=593133 RepID=A0A1I6RJV9_9FLAO|nr:sulfite exporter TauE/SafE family protein [Lutibacter maritimus]SFS64997.1 ABC-type nickel/cobalt efflux system, permease component RcnA [Lutibacter maritimus]